MTTSRRTASGGRIDRTVPLSFRFDGVDHTEYAGDTLASALLAAGQHIVGTGIKDGRPRGIYAAGAEDPNALIQIEEPFPEPMLPATTVELYDGLVASGLPGRGRLADRPDPARYDAVHHHCDLLVVGAGPAGLRAALGKAREGARVVLLDSLPEAGGSLLGAPAVVGGRPALEWVREVCDELAARDDVVHLQRTTAFGAYDDGFVLALEKRTDHLGAAAHPDDVRHRVWRIRADQIVIATGAHERPVVFSNNDRPGVMLATSARTFLHRFGVLAGREAVVFTTNDSAYAAAFDLADAGVWVAAIADARPGVTEELSQECARRGIRLLTGHVVSDTSGDAHVEGVTVSTADGMFVERIPADLLLVAGGWNPAVHLYSQMGGTLRYDETIGSFVPAGGPDGVSVVGAAAGEFGPAAPPAVLWSVPGAGRDGPAYVDLSRDATIADIRRAIGAGLRSVEHIKRYTTIGTGRDQGKTSGVITSGIIAGELGVDIAQLGVTTYRPPYTPVPFAALAGRHRGQLLDPIRPTPTHDWAIAQGAEWEDVGQWKRARCFPRPGETMDQAVARECRAAREGVAFMDGSTLGKIDAQGPDVGAFLDLLYTNTMSTLKVGRARYGVMCGLDGMVADDGTVVRLGDDAWLLTTTTGNAASVLGRMEEWLQTEWPHLRVYLSSVTDHWATFPVVGPRSRDVIAALAPDLDVSAEAFGFMAWRETRINGVPVRIVRISFSGELAYEVNVHAWHAMQIWHAIERAGQPFGITPYGTEAMHILRAEKGFPIIGQDTDGTMTPQDLGMSWVVSKKKDDFVGKRSFGRSEHQRPDRKQLVGLLPQDPTVLLPEGGQIVATADLPPVPVPMLGHVTSSYRSEACGRTFALAVVRGGHERIGETLYVSAGGTQIPVTVSGTVLYDPEGARRDGV